MLQDNQRSESNICPYVSSSQNVFCSSLNELKYTCGLDDKGDYGPFVKDFHFRGKSNFIYVETRIC